MLEFTAELSEIYSELYEIQIHKAKGKLNKQEINVLATKAIENGDYFVNIILGKKDDPDQMYEYLNTILNLELASASKLTKWIISQPKEGIERTK